MSLEQSKKYDSIYQFFYFVVRVVELTKKFNIAGCKTVKLCVKNRETKTHEKHVLV